TRSKRDWSSDVCSSDLLAGTNATISVTGSNSTVTVTGANDTVYVAGSNDQVTVTGANDTVVWAGSNASLSLGIQDGGLLAVSGKIGRASCRERGWVGGG